MEEIYKLQDGEITLAPDKIIIKDKARKQHRMRLISSSLWVFFGVMSVLRYVNTGDQFQLWTGLFIGIGHLVIVIITLFRSSKEEILREEIESIGFKKRFSQSILQIRLAHNKIRQVTQVGHIEDELREYFAEHMKEKVLIKEN